MANCSHERHMQVSKFGSVKVEKLMNIERYSHVMHISSTVSILFSLSTPTKKRSFSSILDSLFTKSNINLCLFPSDLSCLNQSEMHLQNDLENDKSSFNHYRNTPKL